MIEFLCTPPPVRIAQRVAMITMHFYLVQMSLFFQEHFFLMWGGGGGEETSIAPKKNCPGMQGMSN